MKRARGIAAVGALLLLLLCLLTGCGRSEPRAEGIVERWLLALNQGPAGEPDRYATPVVSRAVLPSHRAADPGELDVIEVGRARACGYRGPMVCEAQVPFRVVFVGGDEIRSDALVGVDRSESDVVDSRVFAVIDRSAEDELPSEGGPPIAGVDPPGWLAAFGAAIALAALSEAMMRLARRRQG